MTNKRRSASSIVAQDLEVHHYLHQPKQYECEGSMSAKQTCLEGLSGRAQEKCSKIIVKKPEREKSFELG